MTATFQHWGLAYEWSWFFATITGIRFTVPDAAAEHASMQERGVTVGDLLTWEGVPPMFSFDDPDGNRFYVVEAAE